MITDSIPRSRPRRLRQLHVQLRQQRRRRGRRGRHPCRQRQVRAPFRRRRQSLRQLRDARRRGRQLAVAHGHGPVGASWTGDKLRGRQLRLRRFRIRDPHRRGGLIRLTPKRHSFSVRAGGQNLDGWLQSYRATLGVRRYEHSELEGDEVGTTFHNDTLEGEVLLSHKHAGRWSAASADGSSIARSTPSARKRCRRRSISRRAAFLYEEVEVAARDGAVWRTARSRDLRPAEDRLRTRDFTEYSASVGLLLKPQAANDNLVVALNLARASRYPALEELYYFGRTRQPGVRNRQPRSALPSTRSASTCGSRAAAASKAS